MIDAAKLKSQRLLLNFTQGDLASRAGVSQQLIMEIEAGRTKTSKAIYKLAAALMMPASELDDAIPALDDELEGLMVQIKMLPPEQNELVRRTLKDTLRIAQQRRK